MNASLKGVMVTLALVLSFTSSSSDAGVVNFDDANSVAELQQEFASYSVGGLTFTQNGGYALLWDGLTTPNSNGTNSLISGFGRDLTITRTGGGLFDLNSLDLAISWFDLYPTETILINGTSILLEQGMRTFTLGLSGVSSVSIGDIVGNPGYWALDNIVFNPANSTSEPALLALFGVALMGLWVTRKRSVQQPQYARISSD